MPRTVYKGDLIEKTQTTASANFNFTLGKHFESPKYKLGSNIICRVWETHIRDNASKIPEESFRSNTGHKEAFADRHYFAPLDPKDTTTGDDTTADRMTMGTHTTWAERVDPKSDTESIASSLVSIGTSKN